MTRYKAELTGLRHLIKKNGGNLLRNRLDDRMNLAHICHREGRVEQFALLSMLVS